MNQDSYESVNYKPKLKAASPSNEGASPPVAVSTKHQVQPPNAWNNLEKRKVALGSPW